MALIGNAEFSGRLGLSVVTHVGVIIVLASTGSVGVCKAVNLSPDCTHTQADSNVQDAGR